MPKRWIDDPALIDSMAGQLVSAIAMFPKRLVRVDELVHTFHMPVSHIQVLALVGERDLSIGQLSVLMGVAKPNITPLVDSLYERGMVERVRSGSDRRIVQVHILPQGVECLNKIRNNIADQILNWPECFSKSEMKRLNASLSVIVSMMEQMETSSGLHDQ